MSPWGDLAAGAEHRRKVRRSKQPEPGPASWCRWRRAEAAAWLPVAPVGTSWPPLVPSWQPRSLLMAPLCPLARPRAAWLSGFRVRGAMGAIPGCREPMDRGFLGDQDAPRGAIRPGGGTPILGLNGQRSAQPRASSHRLFDRWSISAALRAARLASSRSNGARGEASGVLRARSPSPAPPLISTRFPINVTCRADGASSDLLGRLTLLLRHASGARGTCGERTQHSRRVRAGSNKPLEDADMQGIRALRCPQVPSDARKCPPIPPLNFTRNDGVGSSSLPVGS